MSEVELVDETETKKRRKLNKGKCPECSSNKLDKYSDGYFCRGCNTWYPRT